MWIKSTSFNVWVRYFVWNFKGLCCVCNCTKFWGDHAGFLFGISLVAARIQLSLSTLQKTKHNGTAKCKHPTKLYTQGFTAMFHKAVHPKQTYTLCQTWRRNILLRHTLFGVDVTNSVNSFSCEIADPALEHHYNLHVCKYVESRFSVEECV